MSWNRIIALGAFELDIAAATFTTTRTWRFMRYRCKHRAGIMNRSISRAILIASLVACGGSRVTEPNPEASGYEDGIPGSGQVVRRVATIYFHADPIVFDVPETVRVGDPLEGHITTYGGGCISEDSVIVSVAGSVAEVIPMQRVVYGGACTAELRISSRPFKVVFDKVGEASIRVTGRADPGDSLIAARRRVRVVQ